MCAKKPVAAIILIVLGFVFLAKNFGWLSGAGLNQWWPVILIIVGVGLFVTGRKAAALR